MENPAIIFDLGGVLVDWNPRYLYRKLFDDSAAMEKFLAEVCSSEWNNQQDRGRTWAEAVDLLAAQFPQHRDLIEAYHHRWEEMLGGAVHGTVEILQELRSDGHELFALTNWSAETFPIARQRFEFLNWFQHIVVSGEERVMKPEPEIFERLLHRVGRPAEECLFIDDHGKNIEAATNLGFDTIRFENPDQLRDELRGRALL